MDFDSHFDDQDWYKYIISLKKHEVIPKRINKKNLPFIDSSLLEISERCNSIAFSLIFRNLPFTNYSSLGLMKQYFYGIKTSPIGIIPVIPYRWLKHLKNNSKTNYYYWTISPILLRVFILLRHIKKSSLLSLCIKNIFYRGIIKPSKDSAIILDFPEESQYTFSKDKGNEYYSLLNTLRRKGIIKKGMPIFSRYNSRAQIQYNFPYHHIPFKNFILFFLKACVYEIVFFLFIFSPFASRVIYLIDDIIEYLYLKEDPTAPYSSIYKTISSQDNTNTLSQLPTATKFGPLAYTNLIFYSQNNRQLYNSQKNVLNTSLYPFPYYSVIAWTKEYTNYLRSLSNYPDIFKSQSLGSIDFIDNDLKIPSFSENDRRIVVFPVEYYSDLESFERKGYIRQVFFYTKNDYLRFFRDIKLVAEEFNIKIIVKNKRQAMAINNELFNNQIFSFLPHNTSARRVIETINPFLVVCMPQTSPALYYPSKSIYYYPKLDMELIEPYEKYIPLIQGKASLSDYIHNKLNESNL